MYKKRIARSSLDAKISEKNPNDPMKDETPGSII